MRLFPPKELVARLKQDLLARRSLRSGAPRHATLRSAIDWSWNLLAAFEQAALAECSVFAGSFTVGAAEAIVDEGPASASPVVERLAALRDKSLLFATGEDGRLSLYVSIREYAAQKLGERGEQAVDDARVRHALHYARAVGAFNQARTFQGTQPDIELRAALLRDKEQLLTALDFLRDRRPREDDGTEFLAARAELAIGVVQLQAAPLGVCLEELGAMLRALDGQRVDLGHPGDLRESASPEPPQATLRMRLLLVRQSVLSSMGRLRESSEDIEAFLAIPELGAGMRALGLVFQGVQRRHRSAFRLAWESHEDAARELAALRLPRLDAMNSACMGRLGADLGSEQLARDCNERALSLTTELGDSWLGALPRANLAQLDHELGRWEAAEQGFDFALQRFRGAGEAQYVAIYTAALGHLHFERGTIDEARQCYGAAAGYFAGWLIGWHACQLYAAWGALEARHGDRAVAESHFERARRLVARCDTVTGRLVVEMHHVALDLRVATDARDARDARDAGDPLAASRTVAQWRERLVALETLHAEDLACSLDARFALRMANKALADADRTRAKGTDAATGCVLAADGAWFGMNEQTKVDLLRRGSLRRILAALVQAHRAHPGTGVDQQALLAHGWPGERLLTEAASTRLRVAIATLRRLGLRDVLLTRDDGYLLDPSAPIRVQ
jgi:tetratricopeptide (TPR) repeat protein